MKIIIVGTAYPYRGGLAAFNERLAQEFVREGHNVEVYTFTLQYPGFLFPGKTQYSTEPDHSGLTIFRKINSCNPFNWIKVGKEIKKKCPDLVIFCYWMSFMAPCMGTIAKQIDKKETKVFSLVHNMIPHEKSIIDKLLPGYFVRQMDGFVALSKSVVDDIATIDKRNKPKAFSPHPIYDHYGRIEDKAVAKQKLQLDKDVHYVLFFGFIREYKGLDLLINAFADERLKALNVKLLIAGEFYGNEESYQNQIDRLGIRDQLVLRTDYIPDSEVGNYFNACDIVAQPYKTATQSGVTQIAFHFEKPMLVTNVGGLPEIVPNGKIGYVVEPDAQQIADALFDYFANDRETTFSQNVITEKSKYAWNNLTNVILKTSACE